MKCPYCKSNDVVEEEIEVFEGGGPVGLTPTEFDPLALLSLIQAPVNAAHKVKLAITDKKHYRCNNCDREFDA